MNESEARSALDVPRETMDRLKAFAAFLQRENEHHNLVSRASLDQLWQRHILDSAQLVRFASPHSTTWLDLGSGAGFPGLLIPLFHSAGVILVESRRLRAEFLRAASGLLGIAERVEIVESKVEAMADRKVDVISARAFAPLPKLLDLAERFSGSGTVWILPKGRNAKSELDAARSSWQGDFRLEPSLTDADAGIIVASAVHRRTRGRR